VKVGRIFVRIILWTLCILSRVLSGQEFASLQSVALFVASGLFDDETPSFLYGVLYIELRF
jgi:hypothetical protein